MLLLLLFFFLSLSLSDKLFGAGAKSPRWHSQPIDVTEDYGGERACDRSRGRHTTRAPSSSSWRQSVNVALVAGAGINVGWLSCGHKASSRVAESFSSARWTQCDPAYHRSPHQRPLAGRRAASTFDKRWWKLGNRPRTPFGVLAASFLSYRPFLAPGNGG